MNLLMIKHFICGNWIWTVVARGRGLLHSLVLVPGHTTVDSGIQHILNSLHIETFACNCTNLFLIIHAWLWSYVQSCNIMFQHWVILKYYNAVFHLKMFLCAINWEGKIAETEMTREPEFYLLKLNRYKII